MLLMIISGRSGSGKSIALRALEDMGFYCVDNLPIDLLPELAAILKKRNQPSAVSIDARNMPESPAVFEEILQHLPEQQISTQLIFLDADQNTIMRRYSDTRRTHPLASKYHTLELAVEQERILLGSIRARADLIIDTSAISVHELAEILRQRLSGRPERSLSILFESFGFKYGLPIDADYVFDVRFLPNPHWDPELSILTGQDKPVIEFLANKTPVNDFIRETINYLQLWLPMLERNNRSYLTIAIGCTGGKHRSVYITEQLATHFRELGKHVQTRHRSLEKNKNETTKTG